MPTYDLGCSNGHEHLNFTHSIHVPHPPCPTCGEPLTNLWLPYSAGVAGDEIDIYIKHGLCYPDGTPRRFRSKSDLKRAAFESGISVLGDTPKPNQRLVEERQQAREARR